MITQTAIVPIAVPEYEVLEGQIGGLVSPDDIQSFRGTCGIVGIVGRNSVADRLVESLKRLEYRGYDSAGIATLHQAEFVLRRSAGKLRNLEGDHIYSRGR